MITVSPLLLCESHATARRNLKCMSTLELTHTYHRMTKATGDLEMERNGRAIFGSMLRPSIRLEACLRWCAPSVCLYVCVCVCARSHVFACVLASFFCLRLVPSEWRRMSHVCSLHVITCIDLSFMTYSHARTYAHALPFPEKTH